MSAMSASSAAPAGLMPLSLIAEHKSAQPPPAVQSLPRSGTDKCVTPGNMAKPTANGMEGPGPLPLVSQLPQSPSSLSAVPELSQQHNINLASNSDGVQPPAAHVYTSSLQNLMKPADTGTVQEGSASSFTGSSGIATPLLSGERRHTEETTVHHMSSSSITTFSTTTSTTADHSRSGITAQLLQLQPSQPAGIHQSSSAVTSPDPTSSTLIGKVSSNPESTVTSPVQPATTTVTVEETTERVQELSQTTQISKLESTTSHKQTEENSSTSESRPSVQGTASQPTDSTELKQSDPNPTVAVNVNSPPKSAQVQSTVPTPTTPATTVQSPPSSGATAATSISVQPPSTDSNSTLKVATLPRQTSKRLSKTAPLASQDTTNTKKPAGSDSNKEKESSVLADKPRRKRLPTQPYQSPIPELNIMAKYKKMKEMNEKDEVEKRPSNSSSDKLIVFYRNEFLAVRNAEGGFYVCQAMQNVYKSSSRIRIRWLSQQADSSSDLYTPDFYDHTEFDCILTNLNLERIEKDKFRLPQTENRRTESILQRALDVESGVAPRPADDTLTETHPDGLDLSLYCNEEQLKRRKKNKKKLGRKRDSGSGEDKSAGGSSARRRMGAGGVSTISASAVAKAKKAAAIKRTAAVKRVVQQAAAVRRQTPSTTTLTGPLKKSVASAPILANKVTSANASNLKKDTKVHSSFGVSKRKASGPSQGSSVVPDKRARRVIPSSQQPNQSQSQNTTPTAQGKTRGAAVVSGNSTTNNKHVTSNNSSGAGGNSTNASVGNTAGSTRRTLRNSK